jgi:hypothetical protein
MPAARLQVRVRVWMQEERVHLMATGQQVQTHHLQTHHLQKHHLQMQQPLIPVAPAAGRVPTSAGNLYSSVGTPAGQILDVSSCESAFEHGRALLRSKQRRSMIWVSMRAQLCFDLR